MTIFTIPHPPVVSRDQWLAERKTLLTHEKELTKQLDRVNAERFAQLRKRYQSAAGLTNEELAQGLKKPVSPEPEADVEPSSMGGVPVDISPEPPKELEQVSSQVSPQIPSPREFVMEEPTEAEVQGEALASAEEVDLSDEWEAMVQEVIEPPPPKLQQIPLAAMPSQTEHPPAELPDTIDIEKSRLDVNSYSLLANIL